MGMGEGEGKEKRSQKTLHNWPEFNGVRSANVAAIPDLRLHLHSAEHRPRKSLVNAATGVEEPGCGQSGVLNCQCISRGISDLHV